MRECTSFRQSVMPVNVTIQLQSDDAGVSLLQRDMNKAIRRPVRKAALKQA